MRSLLSLSLVLAWMVDLPLTSAAPANSLIAEKNRKSSLSICKYSWHIHWDSVHKLFARDDRPTREEIVSQMKNRGQVIGSGRIPAFYTRLNLGANSIHECKCWMNSHQDLIPGSSAAVMFDELVPDDWSRQVATKLLAQTKGPELLNSYQKYLSQVFAEEASGTAWIFVPADFDFENLSDRPLTINTNTFWFWEYPALTQNANIDKVIRVDPFDQKNPPSTSTIWKQGDPTRIPKGLVDLDPAVASSTVKASSTSKDDESQPTSIGNGTQQGCSDDISPDYPFVIGDNGPEPTLRSS